MGIKDLLKFMKPYIEQIHIKKYAGKRVGIDAYSWLHKGAYSCSMELCLNSRGEKKLQYLKYFMHRINLLLHYNITPVVVFDGGDMPCKAATQQERDRRREANRDLALAKFKEGDTRAAAELFQRAVSISPAMAHQLIQILRSESVEFVVAPYEADAQLAYLCSLEAEKGGIDAVITEDSDLLAYCCQAVIFKMDRYGNGEEIVLDKVLKSVDSKPSFCKFSRDLFTGMCVLAGCDFLPSVPGIGIGKSYSLINKYRNLDRALSVLKYEKGSQMPDDYPKSFKESVAVFQHARIYDALSKKLMHMRPLPQELLEFLGGELDFLGPDIPPSVSMAIAEGVLDPVTMKAFDNVNKFVSNPNPVMHKTRKCKEPDLTSPGVDSCFMVFPSLKTSGKENAEKQFFDELTYKKKADALEMLLPPYKVHNMDEKAFTSDEMPLKFPENNPFKKRKVDEIQLTENESSMCMSLDSTRKEVCNSYPLRKRIVGKIYMDEDKSASGVTEQVSIATVEEGQALYASPQKSSTREPNSADIDFMEPMSDVTEVKNSKLRDAPFDSQESVKVMPKKINVKKGTRAEKGSKRGISKGSESKNSILNYLSRVQ